MHLRRGLCGIKHRKRLTVPLRIRKQNVNFGILKINLEPPFKMTIFNCSFKNNPKMSDLSKLYLTKLNRST